MEEGARACKNLAEFGLSAWRRDLLPVPAMPRSCLGRSCFAIELFSVSLSVPPACTDGLTDSDVVVNIKGRENQDITARIGNRAVRWELLTVEISLFLVDAFTV